MSDELAIPETLQLAINDLGATLARRDRPGQLLITDTNFAWCYVYAGDWVADCPAKCGNVELMAQGGDRRDVFYCSYCKSLYPSVRWPSNGDEIIEVLNRRPIKHTRNWYPEGHPTAVAFGIDDGETVEELLAENRAHGID